MTESYPTDPEMIKVIGLITITLIRWEWWVSDS